MIQVLNVLTQSKRSDEDTKTTQMTDVDAQ